MEVPSVVGWAVIEKVTIVIIIIMYNIAINKTEVNVHIISIESSLHHMTDQHLPSAFR